jgi:hypothetical protein
LQGASASIRGAPRWRSLSGRRRGSEVPTGVEYPEDEKDIPNWFAGATLSELWLDIFFSKKRGPKWQPLEPSD